MKTYEKLRYLPHRVDPSRCLHCGEDFLFPVKWMFIEVDGMLVRVRCKQCETSYTVVMSLDQANLWDDMMQVQVADMELMADVLEDAISVEMEVETEE